MVFERLLCWEQAVAITYGNLIKFQVTTSTTPKNSQNPRRILDGNKLFSWKSQVVVDSASA